MSQVHQTPKLTQLTQPAYPAYTQARPVIHMAARIARTGAMSQLAPRPCRRPAWPYRSTYRAPACLERPLASHVRSPRAPAPRGPVPRSQRPAPLRHVVGTMPSCPAPWSQYTLVYCDTVLPPSALPSCLSHDTKIVS